MITVGLPIFRQDKVMHIALEGLCRQVECGSWELIVSSEDDIWHIVERYSERLRAAGCTKIVYDKLKKWVPLPVKWRNIGQLMSSKSSGMMLHAGDCYSHPKRIKKSKLAMEAGFVWYNERKGYFYYLDRGLLVEYDGTFHLKRSTTHLNMCISKKYARKLPMSNISRGIDGWMFKTIDNYNKRRVYEFDVNCKGVDLHGMNTISKGREKKIITFAKPFRKVGVKICDIGLPNDVLDLIDSLCKKKANG